MSYFDHFRILLEFWNIPLVLGQVLHVIYIAHSKKVIRTLTFHFRFSRFVHVLFTKITFKNVEILVFFNLEYFLLFFEISRIWDGHY